MSIVETNVPTISKNQQRFYYFIVSHTILVFAYKQKSVSSIKYQHFGMAVLIQNMRLHKSLKENKKKNFI